jgi:ATP-dependent DNA helicase RecG
VTTLRGVREGVAERLRRLGVRSIRDLLYLFPRRHNDFSRVTRIAELVPGEVQTIVATVWEAHETTLGQGTGAVQAVVGDETGNVRVVWFGRRSYLAKLLKPNTRVVISGRVELFKGEKVFESPEYELLAGQENLVHTGRLVPVYPLTEGLSPRTLRRIVAQALDQWLPWLGDFLPEGVVGEVGLLPLPQAIQEAHYPSDIASKEAARRRLAFDELFLLQMAVLMRRRDWQEGAEGVPLRTDRRLLDTFLGSLPFTLTQAQERSLGEILSDMEKGTPPMSRLLQGEVGSGKTVVALAALLVAVGNGYQGSVMVPTEVLAEQHFATISTLLGGVARPVQEEGLITVYLDPLPRPISIGLLIGSLRRSLKEELHRRIAQGTLDIVVGTHALIQEEVEIPRLALVVVDEQHRFGVLQRAALREKGRCPHVLVMSATPIPRTLALTLYGDLDISVIDQLPPGRQRVETYWVSPERRPDAYAFVRREVQAGRQAFVICPLIEESEAVEAKAATEEYQRLSREVFPDLRVGLLHGRMPLREKEDVMRRFRDGQLDILVSTPVVEVGIDVPNATVMLVEAADRFGLAQLHQFRGRVGRGEHKSYCFLLADSPSPEAMERLEAMRRIYDGFQLAEVDLSLRGPGDFFGTRQSGLPNLRMARLSDQDLLKMAREKASSILEEDPRLTAHKALAREVSRFLGQVTGEIS